VPCPACQCPARVRVLLVQRYHDAAVCTEFWSQVFRSSLRIIETFECFNLWQSRSLPVTRTQSETRRLGGRRCTVACSGGVTRRQLRLGRLPVHIPLTRDRQTRRVSWPRVQLPGAAALEWIFSHCLRLARAGGGGDRDHDRDRGTVTWTARVDRFPLTGRLPRPPVSLTESQPCQPEWP